MTTTANDRLDEILNDTPNRHRQRKTQTESADAENGNALADALAEHNRQIAKKIVGFNAKQTAKLVAESYADGTFIKQTFEELNALTERFKTTVGEDLIPDPLKCPYSPNPEKTQ